jgi:hypothetical protein
VMSRRLLPCYADFPCIMNCACAVVAVSNADSRWRLRTLSSPDDPSKAGRGPNEAALASKKPFDLTVAGGVGKSWQSERSPGRRESAFGILSSCLGGQRR